MIRFSDALLRFRAATEQPLIYADMLRVIANGLAREDREAVSRCDADAQRLHAGQFRSDGAPYIVHPRRVAILAASYPGERQIVGDILMGLTHDLVEDCGVTEEWLRRNYGNEVADGVMLLSAPASGNESNDQRRDRKVAKYTALGKASASVLRLHAMDVLDNTISWRFIQPQTEGWGKIPRWMWQVVNYQIPLLSSQFDDVSRELAKEIEYQRARGFEIGSWNSP